MGIIDWISDVFFSVLVYQGSELWDLSLVDPDNRRPVDYEMRAALLSRFEADDRAGYVRDLLMQGADGRAKLYAIRKLLTLRGHRPDGMSDVKRTVGAVRVDLGWGGINKKKNRR